MTSRDNPEFEHDIDRFIDAESAADPINKATYLGRDGFDDRLADMSATGLAQAASDHQAWQAEFARFSDAVLTPAERIDRDLALAHLARLRITDEWQPWRINPLLYLDASDGALAIFLMGGHTEQTQVDNAIARLDGVRGVLAAGIANLTPSTADPVLVEMAAQQATSSATFARNDLLAMVTDPAQRARMQPAAERAAQAYEGFATFLTGLQPLARGSGLIGKQRYTDILTKGELLGLTADQLRTRAQTELTTLVTDMEQLSSQISGSPDWRSLISTLQQEHAADPDGVRAAYEVATKFARDFFFGHALGSPVPGERVSIEPEPLPWRAAVQVAMYIAAPMFKPSRHGRFFVPYPMDPKDKTATQGILEDNSDYVIPTTAVHEVYPGHHWHLVNVAGSRLLRRVLQSDYFVEGWALYAEQMMRNEGFFAALDKHFDPKDKVGLKAEFGQVQMRAFRAARIIVDIGLHSGDMTVDQSVDFMKQYAGLPEPIAIAEVKRYRNWPTQASAYLTGAMAIGDMWTQYDAKHPRMDHVSKLRAFHDALVHSGQMPLGLAARAIGLGAATDGPGLGA